MRGLLLKDIINLKQQTKIYLAVIGIWLAIAVVSDDGSFLGGMICVLSVMLPITTLAYDEKAKWDKYGLTMPLLRKQIVLSKYILALALSFAGFALSFLFNLFITKAAAQSILLSLIFWGFSVIAFCIVLPIIYKLGVEKGRAAILLVFLAPTVMIILLGKLNIKMPGKEALYSAKYVLPFLILAIFIISLIISVKIYKNKEM